MTGADRHDRYDVIVVGGGMAGSLVARQLGALGRRVLVLEAGVRASDPEQGDREALDRFLGASAKVPGAPYAAQDAAPWPEVTDLAGSEDGYRADG